MNGLFIEDHNAYQRKLRRGGKSNSLIASREGCAVWHSSGVTMPCAGKATLHPSTRLYPDISEKGLV